MSVGGQRRVGLVILVVGWTVGIAGLALALAAIGDHASTQDERAGTGIALLMAGLMVVLLGNYVHHAAVGGDDTAEGGTIAQQPGTAGEQDAGGTSDRSHPPA